MSDTDGMIFQVHPSVVYRLGRELISDEFIALVELIKNSYDADASYARFSINTKGNVIHPNSSFPDANGFITVEDDGFGMDLDDISRGWLTISDSYKTEMKRNKKTTQKKRTPIGEKGLGRLGAQRLGENLEIFTRPSSRSVEYHVSFSWTDFQNAVSLDKVPVKVESGSFGRKKGTLIIISGLQQNQFEDSVESGKIERELSRLLSPYDPPKEFQVLGDVNGTKVTSSELTKKLLESAQLKYDISFDGQKMKIDGRVKLDFLNQGTKKKTEIFNRLAYDDSGQGFWKFLSTRDASRTFNLEPSSKKSWFLDCSGMFDIGQIDKHEEFGGVAIEPGPFVGEIFSVKRVNTSQKGAGVYDAATELRRAAKAFSGVRIYRDGFGVRVDWDWLELGKRWTTAGSYYSLKPENTLGHIDLTASGNPRLVETTDREGFIANPELTSFNRLMQTFLLFTEGTQEFLRREWLNYVQLRTFEGAAVRIEDSPDQVLVQLQNALSKASRISRPIADLTSLLDEGLGQLSEAVPSTLSDDGVNRDLVQRVLSAVNSMRPLRKRTQTILGTTMEYLEEIIALAPKGVVVKEYLAAFDRQMSEMYETVALGLTAEALSHEVFQIADRLAERAGQISRHIRKREGTDQALVAFVEHVNTSVIALRKQIGHLAPSLRYVREKRDLIRIGDYLKEFEGFYRERLNNKSIKLEVEDTRTQGFSVKMNRGKLTQVLDNLLINSEYWLAEDIRLNRLSDARIKISVSSPNIRLWDNGRGIDPSIESLLFQPFTTTKAQGRGRGLGLFICKQLLEADGCEIGVLQRRNSGGRLYIFEIRLQGAQVE